tara:strand:- start:3294 stop:3692 length:399 start_codon:yes stop_codon:yes gene_type:complete
MDFSREIELMKLKALKEFEKAKIKQRTNEDRLSAIGNIYFIFSNNNLKYIGQRQSHGIKTRLDQHLFGKSFSVNENGKQNGTISKWDKVLIELNQENIITFKTILVNPDTLRTTIELELINHFKPEWNEQGK